MHTYVKESEDHWSVIFANGTTRRIVRRFEEERDAARYASFLNGGLEPAWVSEKSD